MNELIKPDLDFLVDDVPDTIRPAIADLMDLIEEYERGNFSRHLNDLFDPTVHRQISEKAQYALIRVYRYVNELAIAELARRAEPEV